MILPKCYQGTWVSTQHSEEESLRTVISACAPFSGCWVRTWDSSSCIFQSPLFSPLAYAGCRVRGVWKNFYSLFSWLFGGRLATAQLLRECEFLFANEQKAFKVSVIYSKCHTLPYLDSFCHVVSFFMTFLIRFEYLKLCWICDISIKFLLAFSPPFSSFVFGQPFCVICDFMTAFSFAS